MLIDDEKAIRGILKSTIDFASVGMYVAGEAESGIEAINTIDEIRPHIVFVDIKMPFMDGIEFSRLAIQRYPRLKIIVLTAFNQFEYARQCIGIGISDFMVKPIDKQEIEAALRKIKADLDLHKFDNIDEPTEPKCSTTAEKIKEYLRANFTSPDLNLASTAIVFGFNPNYLSRMFKSEVGISFSDYLFARRMEMAVELAEKKMLMYQAADQVGIPDPNYFGRCFKKYTGKSYSEFIKSLDGQDR
jgi:YesN/AraC family two-component response regulator